MESPLTVARNEPEAGVEFAGVSLKPFSVARSLLRDSSSALTETTRAAMQIARTAATVRHVVFMFRSPCFVLLRLLKPGQSLVIEVVPRVGKRKGVQFVITDARRDAAVTGSPEEKSVDNGRPVDNRATTGEGPQNFSGLGIQSAHLAGVGACVHYSVGNADGAGVNGAHGGIGSLPENFSGRDVESAPRSPGDCLSGRRQGVGNVVAIRNGDVDSPPIRGSAPFDAAEGGARSDRGAPDNPSIIRIEGPIDTALLSKADDVGDQIRTRPAKVKIRARGHRAIGFGPCWEETGYGPSIEALQSLGPLDLPGPQIESQSCIEEIIGGRAISERIGILAVFHVLWSGVVVARANEERATPGINRRRLPDCAAAITTGPATVIGHGIGFPKQPTVFCVQRHHAAAKTTARVVWIGRERLFIRRHADENDALVNDRRACDDRGRMRFDLRNPSEHSSISIQPNHVRTVVRPVRTQDVADDHFVVMQSGANARNGACYAIIFGNFVRPDELAGLFLDSK